MTFLWRANPRRIRASPRPDVRDSKRVVGSPLAAGLIRECSRSRPVFSFEGGKVDADEVNASSAAG